MSDIVKYDEKEVANSEFTLVKAAGNLGINNLMRQGLGGTALRIFDLPQVTVPSGTSKAWSIPDQTRPSGARTTDTLEGVIIASYRTRGYWTRSSDDGKRDDKPPECKSNDGEIGIGTPGGECAKCPYSQWGPRINGKSAQPQCKEFTHVLMLEKDSLLPINLRIPGTSQTAFRSFVVAAFAKAKGLTSIVTSVGLESHTSAGGDPYQTMRFSQSGELNATETAMMNEYSETIQHIIDVFQSEGVTRIEAPEDIIDAEVDEDA